MSAIHVPQINIRKSLSRRHLLRGAGAVAFGLPWLEAMSPTLGKRCLGTERDSAQGPKRFVAICATLGFHTPFLFPDKEGTDFELTPYLQELADHRNAITLLSGLSHPNQQGNNGHASELTWLTSAQRPGLAGFRNSISIDQLIAQEIGLQTRYPFLALSTSGRSMSWTSSGVEIPGQTSPAKLFAALFLEGTPDQIAAEVHGLKRGQSILDTVNQRATVLNRSLGYHDQQKMEEYFAAIRDLESRLQQSEAWVKRPKPKVESVQPKDVTDRNDAIAKQSLMYDMIALALQSDSTRTVTFQLSGMNAVPTIPGVSSDWHNLSHHGKDPDKIAELQVIEKAEFAAFNRFLSRLTDVHEGGKSVLDSTSVLFGSNLGNASAHNWRNLPILVAGGGFRHGAYAAHDPDTNTPLANLFVQLAQHMQIDLRRFGSSTAESVRGLDT